MNDDTRKLLAGYATNTLSEAERKTLFEAALSDPELFEAIADEQALRDLLDDPMARRELLSRIEPAPASFRVRFAAWLRRPVTMAAMGTAAVAAAVIAIIPFVQPVAHEAPRQVALVSGTQKETPVEAPAVSSAVPSAPVPRPGSATTSVRPAAGAARLKVEKEQPAAAVSMAPQALVESPSTAGESAELREMKRAVAKAEDAAAPAGAPVVMAGNSEPAPAAAPPRADFAMKRAEAPVPSPLRYTLFRDAGRGEFVAVAPNTEFSGSDVVRVRIESDAKGFVTVAATAGVAPMTREIGPGRAVELLPIPLSGTADALVIEAQFSTEPVVSARSVMQNLQPARLAARDEATPGRLMIPIRRKKI